MKLSKALIQAYEVQDAVYNILMRYTGQIERADKVNKDDAVAVTNLARAWESAQDRVRINRNKPLPGSLKPVAKPPKQTNHEDAKPVD